jgi:hypothetical protein
MPYLEVKSEERPRKKRSEIEGWVRSGGRGEGRKRRRVVEFFVFKEDVGLRLENYVIQVF